MGDIFPGGGVGVFVVGAHVKCEEDCRGKDALVAVSPIDLYDKEVRERQLLHRNTY